MAFSMNISVVIITARRADVLRGCIQALTSELVDGDEVLVVSGSNPCTEEKEYALHAIVRVIKSDRMCMPYQRNLGIRDARCQIVAFVDDDATVQTGWRNELLRLYEQPDVGSVVGKEILVGYEDIESDVPPGVLWRGMLNPLTHYTAKTVCDVKMGQGCNMSFSLDVLREVGMFDDNYIVKAYGEESDVFERVRRAGYRILYNPKAAVIHDPATPVEYGRSAFDRRSAFYQNRNNAYFMTKFYFLRLPFFMYLTWNLITFGWSCLKRSLFITAHSFVALSYASAGKCVGVYEGLKWHIRRIITKKG